MTTTHARNTLVLSFALMSLAGGSGVFLHRVSEGLGVAFLLMGLFVTILACVHAIGYLLYVDQFQMQPKTVEVASPLAGSRLSPLYWSALKEGAIVQAIVAIPTALLLDGGRVFGFVSMALLAQWIGTLLVIGRRPNSPTRFDLSFIRLGILPLAFLTGSVIAPLVWKLIAESDHAGWQRLLGG